MRPTRLLCATVLAGLVWTAAAAAGPRYAAPPKELVVALDGTFTSPVTSKGRFVTLGLVADSGTHTDMTSLVPATGQPKLIVITVTCRGAKGSFTFVSKVGVAKAGYLAPGVSASSVPSADTITKATGAYAPFVGAVTSSDLALTSNPLQPGASPKPRLNILRVIDVFKPRR